MTTPWNINSTWTLIAGMAVAALALLLLVLWRKAQPFATSGHVFRATRRSAGNHWLPAQVQVTPTAVVHYTPHWFGRSELSIHIAHVASVRVDSGLLSSDVYVETSGGATPVRFHGHRRRDAQEMQRLIEQYQSGYHRQPPTPLTSVAQNETRR